MNQSKPRTAELVRSTYRSAQALMVTERDAPEDLTLKQAATAVLQPVRTCWVAR